MFVLVNGKPARFSHPLEAFIEGDVEVESLTNKTMLVTYDSPHGHYEKACRNEDMRETIDSVLDMALDMALA